jgi:hypothetical protein
MKVYNDEVVEEVYRTRANLLIKYGGWEGYCKHLEEQQPILEAQGWKFMTSEEIISQRSRQSLNLQSGIG